MDPLDTVEAIARVARTEVAPQTNVRIAPLLRAGRAEWRLAPLAWSAVISAVAACVILTLALHQNQSNTSVDSISPLFNAAQVQMP
jgi:hypothetical protein